MASALINPCTAIHHHLTLGPVSTPTIIKWDPATPAQVEFTFYDGIEDEGVTWAFARSLLISALADGGEHGEGNVTVEVTGNLIGLLLNGDEGIAYMTLPVAAVRWIVNTSAAIIAPDSEFEADAYTAELDAELAELIERDAA